MSNSQPQTDRDKIASGGLSHSRRASLFDLIRNAGEDDYLIIERDAGREVRAFENPGPDRG